MLKSDSIQALSAALALAQAEVKNPHFDSTNPHFKSKFASLGAVIESVIPVFTKHGLTVTQWPVSDSGAAGCITHLAHSSGEWMEERFLIPVDKHNAHGYASAVTYSKRIAMQSVAGVVGDVDDDGNQAVGDNVKGEKQTNGGSYNAKKDAFEAMPPDEQEFLRKIAANVSALISEDRAYDAYGYWRAQNLDADEMVAIQHLWDSKERSALTKAAEQWKIENGGKQARGNNHKGATPTERQAA
jgi:hypothetical protein